MTKWTGFNCCQTGFIHRADKASPLADEASLPTGEASPIGPYMLIY